MREDENRDPEESQDSSQSSLDQQSLRLEFAPANGPSPQQLGQLAVSAAGRGDVLSPLQLYSARETLRSALVMADARRDVTPQEALALVLSFLADLGNHTDQTRARVQLDMGLFVARLDIIGLT